MGVYMETLLKDLEEGMLGFIDGEDDADYSPSDVEKCLGFLKSFERSMSLTEQTLETSLELVKVLVLSLNQLNEDCEECLIETDQREDICEFIDSVLTKCGVSFDDDVTEEWREW